PIRRYLAQDESAYIIKDCGAKLVITSPACAEQVQGLITDAPGEPLFYILDEPLPGFRSFDKEASVQPTTPIPDEVAGYDMLYSSGTTGRPRASRSKSSMRTTRKRPRGRSAHGLFRRCAGVRLSQRSGEDEARLQRRGLADARRRRLCRRRRRSLSHRP